MSKEIETKLPVGQPRLVVPLFANLPFEEQVSQLAAELRALIWDDANDMMQGAMMGCPVECLAFAKWWIQRTKGLPTDVPGDYPVFRHNK